MKEECIEKQETREQRILDGWENLKRLNPELDKISSKDIDPECAKLIDKYFWELV